MTQTAPAAVGARASQAAVLAALMGSAQPLSVAQLCTATAMSRPTVTNAIDILINQRLVAPDELSGSTPRGGRPGRQFRPATREYLVAAVVITRRRIDLTLTDLDGREVGHRHLPVDDDYRGHDDIPGTVIDLIDHCQAELTGAQLCYIVVSVLGVVAQERILVRSGLLQQLEGTALHQRLSAHFETTVIVENDANLAALAEARDVGDTGMILGLLIGADFGCGIVIDGQVHHGANGAAGELQLGVWEQLWALLHSPAAGVVDGYDVYARAGQDDAQAIAFVTETARLIGEGLAPIVEFFDPDRIVIGGEASAAGEHIAAPLRRYLSEHIGSAPTVSVTSLGAKTVTAGAVLLGCQRARESVLRVS